MIINNNQNKQDMTTLIKVNNLIITELEAQQKVELLANFPNGDLWNNLEDRVNVLRANNRTIEIAKYSKESSLTNYNN